MLGLFGDEVDLLEELSAEGVGLGAMHGGVFFPFVGVGGNHRY